jgi:drug/metabolite transporter (DMT)-like permease
MSNELSPRDPSKHVRACFWLVIATLIWGTSFPLVKAIWLVQEKLVPNPPDFFLAALAAVARFGLAGFLIAIFSIRTLRQLTRCELAQGFGLGIFGGLGILFQMDGLAHTEASTSAFLTQFTCLFIPLWVALRRWSLPGPFIIVATLLVLWGMAILTGFKFNEFKLGRGEAETILSALFFAGQILWLERPRYAANRVANFTVVMFATIAIIIAPIAFLTAPTPGAILAAYSSTHVLLLVGALSLACTLAAYSLMNYWQPHVSATEAGLIYCVEPLFTAAFAAFLPGWLSTFAGIHYVNEQFTKALLIGGGLITLANVLIQLEAWRQRRKVANEVPTPVTVEN